MEKNKLSLNNLKVKSFVTSEKGHEATIKGGALAEATPATRCFVCDPTVLTNSFVCPPWTTEKECYM